MKSTKFTFYSILFLCVIFSSTSFSKERKNTNLDGVINELLDQGQKENMFPGIAIALYSEEFTQFYNRGLSKIKKETIVSNETRFQLGSVGKLLTAISILQLYDLNKIDFNADINLYINDLGLDLGTPEKPVTIHCLLTHSCGFNDANIGYMTKNNASIKPLKDYLKKTNAGLFQLPNIDINYSNFSYALAGYIVEELSQQSFSSYVDDFILKPLKMVNSTLVFPEGYVDKLQYATSYRKKTDGFELTQVYPRHAISAGSLISTSQDMSLFIQALYNKSSQLLSPAAWELFYTEQFTNNPHLNGYSYGLERQNINGHISWAKGGIVPGFLAHIVIVPDEFAIFSVSNTDDDRFGELFYKSIFDQTYTDTSKLKNAMTDVRLEDYIGTYRNKRYNHETEENIVILFKGQFNVYLDEKGDSLAVYHNGNWHRYIPVEKDVFQNETIPYEYLVFEKNNKGEINALYRNINIGGLSVPLSLEKTQWYNSPVFINEYYGIIPLFTYTGFIYLFIVLIIHAIKRWKNRKYQSHLTVKGFYPIFFVTLCLHLAHTIKVPWQILTQSNQFLLGYPLSFKIFSVLGYLLIPFTLYIGICIWKIWVNKLKHFITRMYLVLIELSLIIHMLFLFYWGFM